MELRHRIRRVRPTVTTQKATGKLLDADLLNRYLETIKENNRKLAELQAQQNDALAVMFKTMKANKVQEWSVSGATAKITTPSGRASHVIDAEAYREMVSDEEFFDSIKVSNEKAKQYLGTKELEKITTTTPAKPGEPRLDIEYK